MKKVWACAGWTGTLLFVSVLIQLAVPAMRRNPPLVFGSLLASLALCVCAGIFHKKWFLLPGLLAIGLAACLMVSVFAE
jgi:hypothetical protein